MRPSISHHTKAKDDRLSSWSSFLLLGIVHSALREWYLPGMTEDQLYEQIELAKKEARMQLSVTPKGMKRQTRDVLILVGTTIVFLVCLFGLALTY